VRRLLVCALSIGVLGAACAETNPSAPSPVPAGNLNAKADKPANINGVVSDFAGTPDSFSFVVEATPVSGDASTEFYGESLFAHLANGVRVEVKGVLRATDVYARRIHVNSRVVNDPADSRDDGSGDVPPPPPPPPSCSWPVSDGTGGAYPAAPRFGEMYLSSMAGTEPDFVLSGAGRPVYTSGATIVRRNADLLPFWILRPSMIVEIFGTWDSTRIDAAEVNLSRATFDVNVEGSASLVIGEYPEAHFVVGTEAFLANEWTKFSGSPCDVLVEGATLRLRGVRMADGVTALATYVERIAQ
jgi:hypothetical protein